MVPVLGEDLVAFLASSLPSSSNGGSALKGPAQQKPRQFGRRDLSGPRCGQECCPSHQREVPYICQTYLKQMTHCSTRTPPMTCPPRSPEGARRASVRGHFTSLDGQQTGCHRAWRGCRTCRGPARAKSRLWPRSQSSCSSGHLGRHQLGLHTAFGQPRARITRHCLNLGRDTVDMIEPPG